MADSEEGVRCHDAQTRGDESSLSQWTEALKINQGPAAILSALAHMPLLPFEGRPPASCAPALMLRRNEATNEGGADEIFLFSCCPCAPDAH